MEIFFLLFFSGHLGDATGVGLLMEEGKFSLFHCPRAHLSLLDIFPLNLPISIAFLSLSFFFFVSHAFNSSLNTEKKLATPMLNSKFIVLWEVYNWNLVVGWGRRWEGVQKEGDICIPVADSC